MLKTNFTRKIAALAILGALTIGTDIFAQRAELTAKTGTGLYEIVYSNKGKAVYVAAAGNRGENNAFVYKLDPNTLDILDKIDLSEAPGYGLGINDKTQTLYTSNTRNNSVNAIDLKTGVVKTIVPEFERSHTRELVIDEKANKVYVSDVGKESRIWVIDGKTNTLEKVIENTGASSTGIALDAKAKHLYITNLGNDEIAVLDLKTEQIINTFPAGAEGAINLVLDNKTDRLFVANQKSGVVTVLNAKSGQLLKTIPTGAGALGIRLDPKSNRVFVANRQAGTVTVIDAKNLEVVADIETGTHPNTVAVDVKTGYAYVTNKAERKRDDPSFVDPNGDTVTLISFD